MLLLAPDFEVQPLLQGGTGSNSESEVMPEHLPDRLEAGTPNGAGAVGLGRPACGFVNARSKRFTNTVSSFCIDSLRS